MNVDMDWIKDWANVKMCVCVFVLFLYMQNTHSTSKVRTFLGSEGILDGPRNSKGLFEVLWLTLGLGKGFSWDG